MEKKKEEEIKEEEKKIITKEPKADKKKKDKPAFPRFIKVTNKGPRNISRANRLFSPYKTTKAFSVNERQYKEISAHIGLKIKNV